MDTTIVCCSHTIQDETLKTLICKMEEDIKATTRNNSVFFIYEKCPGAQEISVENGPLTFSNFFRYVINK